MLKNYNHPFKLFAQFFFDREIIFSSIGGILMGLTPAPFNVWGLAWIALVPLWLIVFNYPKSWRQVFLCAFAWGCGYQGLALFWITGVHPMTWMGVPWLASLAIALFCWLFITLWGAAIVVAWAVGIHLIKQKISKKLLKRTGSVNKLINSVFNILLGVALWCSLETFWSYGSLWWSPLAYTQSPHNLVILQLGQLSGFSTISSAIVLVNGLLAEVIIQIKNTKPRSIILLSLPISCCLFLHLIGLWLYNLPLNNLEQNAIKVGIIQGNIPNEIKLYSAGWRKALEGYTNGYLRLVDRGVDVVLTPETALPFSWQNIINSDNSFYRAVLTKKIPAWVGAWGKQDKSFTNSLFTLTGEGKTYSRYNKYKLVPLGEYIPFESVLGGIVDRLSPLEAHQAAGKPDQIFETPFGRAIVGICYESAFARHFRRQAAEGGQFIISAANNAHYSKSMPAQHHALDVMRAVETDRWIARATNTGYSAIIDPRGRTLWISAIDRYAIHAGTIYPRETKTLYVRWGNWLIPVLWLLFISCWLFVFI